MSPARTAAVVARFPHLSPDASSVQHWRSPALDRLLDAYEAFKETEAYPRQMEHCHEWSKRTQRSLSRYHLIATPRRLMNALAVYRRNALLAKYPSEREHYVQEALRIRAALCTGCVWYSGDTQITAPGFMRIPYSREAQWYAGELEPFPYPNQWMGVDYAAG